MFLKRFVVLVLSIFQLYPLVGLSARATTWSGGMLPVAFHNANIIDSFDLDKRLAAIESQVDQKRKELGVPGLSLVIVKDDHVIYMKGLGLKDVEQNQPVTPNTLFAIGSSTKAFTAMTVMMSQDDGKLSLEDSPKKYLPYFKLQGPRSRFEDNHQRPALSSFWIEQDRFGDDHGQAVPRRINQSSGTGETERQIPRKVSLSEHYVYRRR